LLQPRRGDVGTANPNANPIESEAASAFCHDEQPQDPDSEHEAL